MKKDYELDYYLWDVDASQEERRCVHMWIRDGHWIDENDYEYENMDFLTAIHHTVPTYATIQTVIMIREHRHIYVR